MKSIILFLITAIALSTNSLASQDQSQVPAILNSLPPAATASPLTWATSPRKGEMAEARRWVSAKLEGSAQTNPYSGHISVSFKGEVLKNMATTSAYGVLRGGVPLRIADKKYVSGLYCPSEGKIVVHLPGPAKSFKAIVGVDSNQETGFYSNAGRGRVIARVEVNGQEMFRSDVMHGGMPGESVAVELGGAEEFVLHLDDAGGGIVQRVNFNKANWAEAQVTLADGRMIWLSDLPFGPLREDYTTDLPFSFQYGGRPSSELITKWERKHSVRNLDEKRTEHTLIYSDPATGLELRCIGLEYKDYPTVEWMLYFKNTSNRTTPIIENILALDMTVERDNEGEFVLHHNVGSSHSMVKIGRSDYQPLETKLERGTEKLVGSSTGLPGAGDFPYFNFTWRGKGVIVAIGWPGQWAGRFKRDNERKLKIEAGQELTRFKLLPGEEVRAPRIVMLFWEGDWIRAQNLWRRWMMAHNMPRPGGKLPKPQIAASSASQYIEMSEANEENQLAFIERYAKEGIKFDYWWIDAGWHVFKDYWLNIGTWEPDPIKFPRGLRPISDHLHARGQKMILWFAPEYATPGTLIYNKPPEWLLGRDDERFKQVNLGNPAARNWLIDYIDKQIKQQGVDLYRHDANPPLSYWRGKEAADRQGITENHYVDGYLAYWDEIRARNPDMLTDICAGGGGRNDVEGMRRAVPLWRSDFAYETTGMQNITYGMSMWVPYFGTGVSEFDMYACRSQMAPALSCVWDLRNRGLDYEFIRRFIAQWRQVADNYYGDYYPLTTFRAEDDVWMAWQFDRPEVGEGMVQAFRRPKSDVTTMRFRLRGLDPESRYTVTNLDVEGSVRMTGRELLEQGLIITLEDCPMAAIITYRKLK